MAIRAFYSGVESKAHFLQCKEMGIRYMLMSYWQFYDKNPDLIKQRKKNYPDAVFCLDSGAHSFLDSDNIQNKFSKWRLQDFENYLEGYIRWLKKYKGYYSVAVEFDIYATLNLILGGSYASRIGTSIVEGWQHRYFMPLIEKGHEIIMVYHNECEMVGWERLCKEFPYVGLPGEFSKNSDFNRYMMLARRFTTKVHGFGAFKPKDFRDISWYSIDATTWKSPEMYGLLIHWTGDFRLVMEPDKLKWAQYKAEIVANGFDGEAITSDKDYKEKTRYSIFCFQQMEKHYNRMLQGKLFYYDLRLPHPLHLLGKTSEKTVIKYWKRFRPSQLFKRHADENNPYLIRQYLCAISAAQYRCSNWYNIHKEALDFMSSYWPQLFNPLTSDLSVIQREVAAYTAPPNPPPKSRVALEHWETQNNAKPRDEDLSYIVNLDETIDLELGHQLLTLV